MPNGKKPFGNERVRKPNENESSDITCESGEEAEQM